MEAGSTFRSRYEKRVLPYYRGGAFGEFSGAAGLAIRFAAFKKKHSRGALLILPGKSETYLKYAELFYDLRDLPLDLYAMDHRGMGFSERPLADPLKTHVERFDNYTEDLHTFLQTVVGSQRYERLLVLGHSTGALIAALYMQHHPGTFRAGVLCSPFFALGAGPLPDFALLALVRLLDIPCRRERYAPGQGKVEPPDFQGNTTTHSRERWALWEREIIPGNAGIRSAGVTNHWLRECLIAGRRAVRGAADIGVPLLLLQAGEDTTVGLDAQDRFCRRAPRCEKVRISGARHEILIEEERMRSQAIARLRSFLIAQI
ncbi:MAG: alpha/beta fold hydrolase [Spirochaetales bacterium]|nr:alpha/beta fold hydrolase [Spirochaetales bacterium]